MSPGDAFAECTEVAKESFRRLAPFIEQISGGRFVPLDRGALAAYLQQRFGDVLLRLPNGMVATLELKAEEKNTGNTFFEVYSNLVGSRRQHYEIANRAGWTFTSQATFTLYHFLDDDSLFAWDTLRAKRWAYGHWKAGTWRAGQLFRGDQRGPEFPERPHTKRPQQNNSVGRRVPHRILLNECGAVRLRVGQGELFEQPFTAAA